MDQSLIRTGFFLALHADILSDTLEGHPLPQPLEHPVKITPRGFFRVIAIAEAVTWTLLITSLILKYGFHANPLVTTIAGGLHGVVFITYALTSVLVGVNQRWSLGLIAFAVATAVVPYATIPFDIWADRRGRLDGPWRTEPSADPRDAGWIARLLRWMLTHPKTLVTLFIAAVVIITTTLLLIGPPGGSH